MNKKKHRNDTPATPPVSFAERHLRDLHELITGREFESAEAVNTFLAENFNGSMDVSPVLDTPEKQAQELVYDAWEAPTDDAARGLAQAALEIDPDCPDALTLLSQFAESHSLAIRMVERAVSAAENRLGSDAFEDDAGHFWGAFETRPYMRARFVLAQMLWDTDEQEEAIGHAHALLDLNPSDNQGIRNHLVGWLLYRQDTKAAARLLRRFEDDRMAMMEWARALQRYQSFGETRGSRIALLEALDANPAVAAYLLDAKTPPAEPPDSYQVGSDDEAIVAEFLLGEAWWETEGAVDWLVEILEEALGERPSNRGPLTPF
ncbi:MAG: hypothetical protein U1E22_03450 [Coriobacteriia bacterium]|nr:hypothetical protein [Coriobacteriia bacterium]